MPGARDHRGSAGVRDCSRVLMSLPGRPWLNFPAGIRSLISQSPMPRSRPICWAWKSTSRYSAVALNLTTAFSFMPKSKALGRHERDAARSSCLPAWCSLAPICKENGLARSPRALAADAASLHGAMKSNDASTIVTDGNLGPPIRTWLHVSARAAPRAAGTVLRRPRAASDLRHRDGSGHASAA